MDYSDFQFGNFEPDLDLTPDITGTTYRQPLFDDQPETDLPKNFWFQNYSSFSLIRNNDQSGKSVDKFSEDTKDDLKSTEFCYSPVKRRVPALQLYRYQFSPV
jgi:hypothetical protein